MPRRRGQTRQDAEGPIGRSVLGAASGDEHSGSESTRELHASSTPYLLAGMAVVLAREGWTQEGPFNTIAGPVTTRVVDPATTDWPHCCTECGRRDHAGTDCPNIARMLSGWEQ